MNSDKFFEVGKKVVKQLAESTLCPTDNIKLSLDNVYMVLYAYVLGNMKATFSTNLSDGKYYEVTYNSTTDELYVDQYVKINQRVYQHIDLNERKVAMASEYGESCKAPYQDLLDSIDDKGVLHVDRLMKLKQKINHPKTEMASEYGESCKSPYQEFVDSIDEENTIAAMRNIEEGFNLD